jgi:hypothetical protein
MAFLRLLLGSKACWAMVLAVMVCAGMWYAGYVRGQSVVQSAWNSEQARTAAGIVKNIEVQDDRNHVAAVSYEQKREQRAIAYRDIVRVVERVADCSVDADILRQWNAANGGGEAPASAGQPDDAVQNVANGDGSDVAGSGDESH